MSLCFLRSLSLFVLRCLSQRQERGEAFGGLPEGSRSGGRGKKPTATSNPCLLMVACAHANRFLSGFKSVDVARDLLDVQAMEVMFNDLRFKSPRRSGKNMHGSPPPT